jgi:hypothetical protein
MKYQKTYRSQCGGAFGAGDEGFSSCAEHTKGNKDLMFAEWYDSLEGTKSQGFAYKAWCAGWNAALVPVKCDCITPERCELYDRCLRGEKK